MTANQKPTLAFLPQTNVLKGLKRVIIMKLHLTTTQVQESKSFRNQSDISYCPLLTETTIHSNNKKRDNNNKSRRRKIPVITYVYLKILKGVKKHRQYNTFIQASMHTQYLCMHEYCVRNASEH